jgi:hypothetical protein
MHELLEKLCCNKEKVETIIQKIEFGEIYIDELKQYLPMMNEIVTCILYEAKISINEEFLVQVLHDLIDGIERQDDVILLDTLQYGWLEILNYVNDKLQGENIDE